VILRDATADDAVALAAFDVGGPPTAWLDEVTEIVSGLISWQHDHEHQQLDRRVIVADADEAYPADDRPYARFTLRL